MKTGQAIIRFIDGNLSLWRVTDTANGVVYITEASIGVVKCILSENDTVISKFDNDADARNAFEILSGLKSTFDHTIETVTSRRNEAIIKTAKQWGTKH